MGDYWQDFERRFRSAVGDLADGAFLRLEGDGLHGNSWIMVRPIEQPQGDVIDRLMRGGWLDGCANGGTCRMSDAGKLAYLRSTDELQNVGLVDPADKRGDDRG